MGCSAAAEAAAGRTGSAAGMAAVDGGSTAGTAKQHCQVDYNLIWSMEMWTLSLTM